MIFEALWLTQTSHLHNYNLLKQKKTQKFIIANISKQNIIKILNTKMSKFNIQVVGLKETPCYLLTINI